MGWWYVYGGRGWRGNGFTTQRGGNIAPGYLGQVAAELGSGHYTTNPRSPLRPWCVAWCALGKAFAGARLTGGGC